MAGIRNHLPSKQETFLVFTAVFLPVQFWMLYNLILSFPAYRVRLPLWDLVGIIAYTQAFALLESLLVFIGLVILMLLLPLRWRGNRLVASLSMLIFIASFWSILFHLFYLAVIEWGARQFILWLLIILVTGTLLVWSAARRPRVTGAMIDFLDRATVLTGLYLAIDLISVIIIGIRNIIALG